MFKLFASWLAIGFLVLAAPITVRADADRPIKIKSFSVGPDEALIYPGNLKSLPDEHTTIIPLSHRDDPLTPGGHYLFFVSAKIDVPGGTGGAVVLETGDLQNFDYAAGYNSPVLHPPLPINKCNPDLADNIEFDENYAAPGSVLQDPTLPPRNMIMLYEAENHCPGGVVNQPYYATVGFARSADNGVTWPAPIDSEFGGPSRHVALAGPDPQPIQPHGPLGNAIPSGFIDKQDDGETYLYVTYGSHFLPGSGNNDGMIRVARARLDDDDMTDQGQQPTFYKWNNAAFSEPGVGGVDSGVLPAMGCPEPALQKHSEINYNDDLGLYLMIFVCTSKADPNNPVGGWYYSAATSLDLQDWTTPQLIINSDKPIIEGCDLSDPANPTGEAFDGFYPSSMSPQAAAGHTKLTGKVFFLSGCETGTRQFMSRDFTITIEP